MRTGSRRASCFQVQLVAGQNSPGPGSAFRCNLNSEHVTCVTHYSRVSSSGDGAAEGRGQRGAPVLLFMLY